MIDGIIRGKEKKGGREDRVNIVRENNYMKIEVKVKMVFCGLVRIKVG